MKKGEVWIVEIPVVNGHEQSGLRPAIFIADTKTNVAIVIPCTSNLQALRFPFTLRIEPSSRNGLATTSIALILQLRAVDKKRLQKRIGRIESRTLNEFDAIMRTLLSI